MASAPVAVALVAAAVLAWLLLGPWLRRRRRAALLAEPLADARREIIDRNVPVVQHLPAGPRRRLESLVSAFLAEKEFVGCNGFVVTEEVRCTIAALACLLVLGRRGHYDELHSILVYPTAFWVEDEVEDESGVVTRRRRELSGEAWDSSRIILSWDDIAGTAACPGEGYNVALHEFAHYLDAEGGGPALPPRAGEPADGNWADAMADEYTAFCRGVDADRETFLDPYAAEDEAEFFAVASEEVFERPDRFRAEEPRLYALMQRYYGVDPAAWLPTGTLVRAPS